METLIMDMPRDLNRVLIVPCGMETLVVRIIQDSTKSINCTLRNGNPYP